MKKVLMTLVAAFAICGAVFAQGGLNPNGYETHYPFDPGLYEMVDYPVAHIQLNGEIITQEGNWADIEIASFVDGEIRGHNFLTDEWIQYGWPYPLVELPVNYTATGEEVYFKVYDHVSGIEYDATCNITIHTGEEHTEIYMWEWDDAVVISYTVEEPETHYWDEADTWEGGSVPLDNDDVTLTNDVIIRANTVVHAGNVNLNGHTLTMEPGAEFYHTNGIDMTIQMEVEGYGEGAKDDNPDNDGYRLIASPISTNIDVPDGLLEGAYDLYYFDQNGQGDETHPFLEWRNYKDGEFTQLEPGKGYAYANEANVFVVFAGSVISTDDEVSIEDLANVEGVRLQGWNLVGNPFTCKADIADDWGSTFYYALNEAGDEVYTDDVAEGIAPMGAVFIDANEVEGTPYFFKYGGIGNKVKALSMTVTRDRGNVIDKATLRFDNGSGLRKLQLNPNHTKVYMTMDGQDYAVLRAPEMGEMPVSFKAENNGTYTLNFASKEVSFNYLHLIDNMTGADVDLLQTPVYTFDAQTTDYASRFKLVFATGNNSEDNFAFFSNGSFVINNDGEATLQVIDVMGRILKSETINGSANVNVNAAPGVYMLRLINGSNMKVQKVIVK